MVKNIFNSFSNGFFHFLGKFIAIIFVGFIVYTLVTKISPKTDDVIKISNLPYVGGAINEK